jgi:hypothetical protein
MPKIIRVLKKDQIKVSGSVRLTPEAAAPVRTAFSARAGSPQSGSAPQSARIVESNSDYAVIEVICSCGKKNHVQCNYADVAKSKK